MATVVLQYAGAALGTFLGGPLGGILGRAAGGIAGNLIDQKIFGSTTNHEGPRLGSLRVMASEEGSPIPVIYGRMRIAGQVIWATQLEEVASTTTQSTSSKGGLGPKNSNTDYSYFASFAVGLCEGEISGIDRVWADGKEIDIEKFSPRVYAGTETQPVDSLIAAVEPVATAYRGLAYVVFERLPLASFGNRLPQLAFEVLRRGNDISTSVKAMNIIPGSTEFGYDTTVVTRQVSPGVTTSENAHVSADRSDWSVAVDQLQGTCKQLDAVSLVVAWFGDDLRCGTCTVRPGVDNASKITSPVTWRVSGASRSAAHNMTLVSGAPAYGGTPADASVIRAIQDIRARNLKVMFYPFLLMDIAATNSLPDPYGGARQAAYPWRGRITSTANKTTTAATHVASFLGSAQPAHFTAAGETVNYSGPAEWSYRRMILHYAKLCALAGGVDAFLLGSEMVGLSTLRGASNSYPFVSGLQTLAAEVKAILPSAKISYGADWSEYFGHQPSDGSNDIYFHLDPLWASSSIDFIGIDNYLPLSDWRDGVQHTDYLSGTRSIYDQAYLQARVAGGEYYDWYYASPAARTAQTRTTISDGTYNKSWMFRPKDLKNWWSSAHYNRPAGAQTASATAWVPQSKPIWFTEAGCPAIDKGTNQPNSFYDAKSAESSLPYFSGGQQDTQIQAAYVQALQSYWSATGAQNPVSVIYSAPMVNSARIFFWAWDARPFPAFPSLSDVWADGPNYARGHWLNGRMGAVDLGSLITAIAARFGFNDIDVSNVEGQVDGFVLDRPMSARDALESLLQSFGIDAIESDGLLKFRTRRISDSTGISLDDLVEEGAGNPILLQTRAQETELPYALRIGYVESGLDYRTAAVSQVKLGTGSAREISINLAAAMGRALAQARADVALEEAWLTRETAHFALPPQYALVEPGDVITLGTKGWRVKHVIDGIHRRIEAVASDPGIYEPPPAENRVIEPTTPAVYGKPDVLILDVAMGTTAAPWVCAQANPWPGNLAVYKKSGAASFVLSRTINQQATIGTTQTILPVGRPHRIDYATALNVVMRNGALASISKDELLNGGNQALIGDAASGYELIQFLNAELVAANTYRLTGLLRGQAGSEAEMLASRSSGQNFVLFNAAVVQLDLNLAEVGLTNTYRVGPAQLDHGHPSFAEFSFTGVLRALRPLPPTQLKASKIASGIQTNWIRRTRLDGDSWDLIEVPVGETVELYQLDILSGITLKRSVTTITPTYLYANADAISDFGSVPSTFTLRVAQVSSAIGKGTFFERTVNV